MKTSDFKSFVNITRQVSVPPGHKHGTALRIEKSILEKLLEVPHK
jgi:hypothetical protein